VKTTRAIRRAVLIFMLAAVLAACGHKGPLLAPLASVPSPPSDIKVLQRGGRVVLEWKNPTTYIDGHPLERVEAVAVWMAADAVEAGQPAPKPLTADEFEAKASLLGRVTKDLFPGNGKEKTPASGKGREAAPKNEKTSEGPWLRYEYDLKAGKTFVARLTFGLKAEVSKRKQSEFSGLSAIRTRALPSPPGGLQAVAGNAAIELVWAAPADNIDGSKPATPKGYNLYRADGGGPPVRLNSDLIKDLHFADKSFEFDKAYVYTVRAAAEASDPFWESDDSAAARAEPKDVFAPATPAGLTSLAGPDFISLTWDPNPDKDLAGYRVWRRVEGQEEFQELTTAPIRETTFQDKSAGKGVRYEYAVTAEDALGNRSERSAAVSERIKE
jgi:predicted small lipoprotein YifL